MDKALLVALFSVRCMGTCPLQHLEFIQNGKRIDLPLQVQLVELVPECGREAGILKLWQS